MHTTHLQAKAMLLNGEGSEAAWAVAQQDEGLKPGTTKEQWLRFMSTLIAQEAPAPDADDFNWVGSRHHY